MLPSNQANAFISSWRGPLVRFVHEHLPAVRQPMLFISGTRDRLCDLTLLRRTLGTLTAQHRLHLVHEGDHAFNVLKRTGKNQHDVFTDILTALLSWLDALPPL